MTISAELRRECGFQHILDGLECMSPFGRERLQRPVYYSDREALETEYERVRRAMRFIREEPEAASAVDRELMGMRDIRGSLSRCRDGETLTLAELFEVKRLLLRLEALRALCLENPSIAELAPGDRSEALALLDPRGEKKAVYHIEDNASPALRDAREAKRDRERRLYACREERDRTALLQERELACAAEERAELAVREKISRMLAPHCEALTEDCGRAGHLDLLLRKAALAAREDTSLPTVSESGLHLKNMTSPSVAEQLAKTGRRFVPLTMDIAPGATVITGANMGGKSVALRAVACNVLLGMGGFPVFAEEACIPIVRGVRLLTGDAERPEEGLSSFGGEIARLRDAVRVHGKDTLLLVDEPARGTNPEEGAALVRALTEWLNGQEGFAVMTTHYSGAAAFAGGHYRIRGLHGCDTAQLKSELAARPDDGPAILARHMDYGLVPAPQDEDCPHEAMDICRLLGLPEEILSLVKN